MIETHDFGQTTNGWIKPYLILSVFSIDFFYIFAALLE